MIGRLLCQLGLHRRGMTIDVDHEDMLRRGPDRCARPGCGKPLS